MEQEGNAHAIALMLVRRAETGTLPLKVLKEQTAAHLAQHGAQVGAGGVDPQVLEAIYSLVSSSLISIDRTSPEQTVSVNLA